MDIDGQRRIVTGVGEEGVRVGQYLMDGLVNLSLIAPNAGNGPCWSGDRIFLDIFERGIGWWNLDRSGYQPAVPGRITPASFYAADEVGDWALYLADGVTGIQTSWGLTLKDYAWLGGIKDFTLFIKPFSGQGMSAYDVGTFTPRWTIPTGESIDFFAVDAERALWTDGARRLQVRGLPPPVQSEPIFMPFYYEALGRSWLAHVRSEGGFIIRPWDDDTHGVVVVPLGQEAFNPFLIAGDDPRHVIACWGLNAGETVIQAQTIDLSMPLQPIPLDVPPIVYPVVERFAHAISIAPFKDLQGVSGSDSHVVIDGAQITTLRKCWVGPDKNGGTGSIMSAYHAGLLYGIVCEGPIPATIRQLADTLKTRIAWWSDGQPVVPVPTNLNAWDQVWHEWYWYRELGESWSQMKDRWARAFDLGLASRCRDLGGIPQYYNRLLFTAQEVVDIIGTALDMFGNRTPRLRVIAPFEYDRPNGITGLPAAREMYQRTLAASNLGAPVFTPAWPTPPPVSRSLLLFPFS